MPKVHTGTLPTPLLITGGTGFIGTHLLQRLVAEAVDIAVLTLPDEVDQLPSGVQAVPGDITNSAKVEYALRTIRPRGILHLAAVGLTNPNLPLADALRVNVGGVVNLLNATREVNCVQRLVLVGSSYEYGTRSVDAALSERSEADLNPFNAYSASKVAGWAFARAAFNTWRAPVVWVRPFQVYGPGQHAKALIPAAIDAAWHGADFPMTEGKQRRDFIHVTDVVTGLLAALAARPKNAPDGLEGHSLDLGAGKLHSLADVVRLIWDLTSARGQILTGTLPYRPGEVTIIAANVARTRQLTGWEARVALEEGLRRTIEAHREGRE